MSKRRRHRPPRRASQEASQPRPGRDSFWWPAFGIFGCALIVRVLHLWQLRTAPFFSLVIGDAARYDTWARAIAAGDWMGTALFSEGPLYPYFLGAFYTIAGPELMVVRVCQAIVGSLSCVLLGAAAWRLFSKPVGIAAGLLLALCAPAIFAGALIQPSVLVFFLLSAAVWLVRDLVERPQRRLPWIGFGFVLGCVILTHENTSIFVVAILGWLAAQGRMPGTQRLALAAMLVIGLGGALLPVAARNVIVGGELRLTTPQFGTNFYIGNNAQADGTYQPLRGRQGSAEFEREDATRLAEQAIGRPLTAGEVSRYWTRLAIDDIVTQPGVWLRLMARKLALLSNATEIAETESQYTHAEWSMPLRLAGFVTHVGVLAPVALVGVWVTWRQRDRLWLLYAMCCAYAASVIVFYVSSGSRTPLLPFLVLFAAAGLVGGWSVVREGRARQLAPGFAAALAFAVIANWPLVSRAAMQAATEDRFGTAFRERGELDQAVFHYRRALALEPGNPGAHNNLGITLHTQGHFEDAARELGEALRLEPDDPLAHYNLGNVLSDQGRTDEALRHYRTALELAPGSVGAHNNLGILLVAQGAFDEAADHFQEAIRLDPDDSRAFNNLGKVFEAQEDFVAAIPYYRRAVQAAPEDSEARGNLGWALFSEGQVDEAIRELRRALETEPEAFTLHNRLGVALGTEGQLDEAIVHFRRAVELEPDFAEARNNLSMALQLGDQPD